MNTAGSRPTLQVSHLQTSFMTKAGEVKAVNDVSFSVHPGQVLGLVGEAGSGKTVTGFSIMGLLDHPGRIIGGEIQFQGENLVGATKKRWQQLRGSQIAMVFQDPMMTLNPVLRIDTQMIEAIRAHESVSRKEARQRARDALGQVGIPSPDERLKAYPHQFSGGMRQRVMIAIALSCDPKVLIADEPTTALDVTIQAQILDLVKRLRKELGMAIVWVTHDLGVVASLADRVMVMYSGFIVERANVEQLYGEPKHPYTMALLATLPEVEGERATRLESIEGQPPDQLRAPTSCPFAPRCSYAFDRCSQENPLLQSVSSQHEVACWWDVQENRPRDYN